MNGSRIVEFRSEGATLRGRFFKPSDQPEPLPVVVMAHGFTATISGMIADDYATVFCESGLAVLLYDHRNFGISDGEPRQEVNMWCQARGYRDAIDFVSALPEVDSSRIAIWGDSISGAEVLVVGAVDRRVKAIVAQVPACGDASSPDDPEGSLYSSLRETLLEGDIYTPETIEGPCAVVSSDQRGNPSLLKPLTAFRWFIEYGGKYGSSWDNWASFVVPTTNAPFHPGLCAPHIKAPLMMMIAHNDEMRGSNSDISRQVFKAVPQPKELVELDGGHFGLLWHPSALFDQASSAQQDFLQRFLWADQKGRA